ncbi:MAG: CPBP family intramembrane glutamic endopeptidase [Terriglobales bacterium]
MINALRWPILGVLAAIAITSTMDATGLTAFSALPLALLLGIFWYLQRFPRRQVGFGWGRWPHYFLAVVYPVVVAALIILVATVAGAVDLSHTNWKKAGINFALVALSTVLVAIITEEGFFRGWLWASLERAGVKKTGVLIWSSIAFSLWHWSAVMLKTGFDPARSQVPVFMLNAAVIGAIWGLLRWRSGSVIVSSVSHGAWNGMAYVLFGFGKRVGALGIKNTGFFGPEIGVLGLVLNLAFMAALWRWCRPSEDKAA